MINATVTGNYAIDDGGGIYTGWDTLGTTGGETLHFILDYSTLNPGRVTEFVRKLPPPPPAPRPPASATGRPTCHDGSPVSTGWHRLGDAVWRAFPAACVSLSATGAPSRVNPVASVPSTRRGDLGSG